MSLSLIDDAGKIWPGVSRTLRASFDSPFSGGEFVDYAIANLGFVAINVYGKSCQLRLRPAFLSDAAETTLFQWLVQSHYDRFVVSWLHNDWVNDLIRSPSAVVERLEQIRRLTKRSQRGDFLARPVSNEELDPQSQLGKLVRNWPMLQPLSGQRALLQMLSQMLGNRYVVVKKEGSARNLLFQEIGGGMFSPYETWRSCAIGAPIDEQPDRCYGKWVAESYREALEANRPMIADVDAIVRWPHCGRTRMRYKRLIVPVPSTTGPPRLLGGPVLDDGIDLRVGAGT